jgi:hypothetical protein
MGQGTTGVAPQQLEAEITSLRDELSALVGELDYRRHELLDVKLQLRRHAWKVATAGLGLAAGIAGVAWLGVSRARRRRTLMSKAFRLREGVGRMINRPERVATDPTMTEKVFTVAASAVLAAVARKAVEVIARRATGWDSGPSARRAFSDDHRREPKAA